DLAEWTTLRADLNRAIMDGSITEERAAEILIEYARANEEGAASTEQLAEAGERLTGVLGDVVAEVEAAEEAVASAGAAVGVFAAEMVDGLAAAEAAAES